MIITTDELLQKKEWLHTELLQSLPDSIIHQVAKDQFCDVKLLVNGVELEPSFYNDLVKNIAIHIKYQAKSLVLEKLDVSDYMADKLSEIIRSAIENITTEFNLKND